MMFLKTIMTGEFEEYLLRRLQQEVTYYLERQHWGQS